MIVNIAPSFYNDGSVYYTRIDQQVRLRDDQELRLGTDGDARLFYDSSDAQVKLNATSTTALPLVLGGELAADSSIIFEGNAVTFHIGIDDSADDFVLGLASTIGGSNIISIDSDGIVKFNDTSGIYFIDSVGVHWGNGADYRMRYDVGNTRWAMWSNDTDGSGSNADIIRIDDGQTAIDALSTWTDGFDDYDDAMLLASSISPTAESYDFGQGVVKRGKEALIEAGVLKKYEDNWVGFNDQRMSALLAGGIYQTRALVDSLEKRVNELEDK